VGWARAGESGTEWAGQGRRGQGSRDGAGLDWRGEGWQVGHGVAWYGEPGTASRVLSPNRLARKYVYQVLLLEEFQRAGCQAVLCIAEYERALLGERSRRGKLQRARAGQYLSSRAPYGYRYVPKREGVPGHPVIDEAEADLVRTLYSWLIDERMTIRQILRRLNFGPHRPRCWRLPWSASTVHHILADPIYSGTAYSNRYRYVPPPARVETLVQPPGPVSVTTCLSGSSTTTWRTTATSCCRRIRGVLGVGILC
jgi:Recombinase